MIFRLEFKRKILEGDKVVCVFNSHIAIRDGFSLISNDYAGEVAVDLKSRQMSISLDETCPYPEKACAEMFSYVKGMFLSGKIR